MTTIARRIADEAAEHVLEGEDASRIEAAGEGLVEEQDRGLGNQGRGDGDFLFLTVGIAVDRPVPFAGQLKQFQQPIDVLHEPVDVQIVEPADAEQEFAAGAVRRQPGMIGQINDAAANGEFFFFRAAAAQAIDFDVALLRRQARPP